MSPPPTLHLFCGKPGAGKTTLAAQLMRGQAAILLSEDLWLQQLFGDQMKVFDDYIRFSRRLRTVVAPLVVDLLKAGQSVVLDFQANTRTGRAAFRSLIEQAGSAHVLHWLNKPDEVCLAQIARRNENMPAGSVHLTEAQYRHVAAYFQAPEADEGFHVQRHT